MYVEFFKIRCEKCNNLLTADRDFFDKGLKFCKCGETVLRSPSQALRICYNCKCRLIYNNEPCCPECGAPFLPDNSQLPDQIKEEIYRDAHEILDTKFVREGDVIRAKMLYLSIPKYKDSSFCVKDCDKKVADLKYSVIYYKAGVKVISAREMYRDACRTDYARKVEDAVVLLKDARQIFSTITAYEDSAQRVEECEKLIAEYTATADKFNKEKEKKDKRQQRGEVMKKVKIGGMIAFGLFCIGMYAFFRYFA